MINILLISIFLLSFFQLTSQQPEIIEDHGSFPEGEYLTYKIRSVGVNFNFQDSIQHLSFLIRTHNEKYYQLDLRLTGYGHKKIWKLLLQQDDTINRLRHKYFHPHDCYVFKFEAIDTMKDIITIAENYIKECNTFSFFFKYVSELKSISEWEAMLDFDHEKRMKRVNCMAFTDYVLRRITTDLRRRWVREMVLDRGGKLLKALS